jgi:hypothetical protein
MPLPELPELVLDEEWESKIFTFLEDEITRNLQARQPRQDVWEEIEDYYDKQILEEKKDFPFDGAAHLMISLMPQYCERAKAKIIKTLYGPRDPFTVSTERSEIGPALGAYRKFCTRASKKELGFKKYMKGAVLEATKLGNCVAKVIYEERTAGRWVWDGGTGKWREVPDIVEDQPKIVPVQLADYLFPMEANEQEDMEWEAHRVRYSWNELLLLENNGTFKNIEDLRGHEKTTETEFEEGKDDVVVPVRMEEFEVWEVWFRHPLKEDGLPVEQVWYIELDSRTVLRKLYNWLPLAERPFVLGHYELRTHKVYSNGVGHMALAAQKEVSTMHNQRLDAGSLKNAPIFKRKSDSIIPERLRVRLGDTIPVDDMEDLQVMPLGSQYDSTLQDELHTISLLEQRVGLRDFMTQDAAGSAQATAMLAMMAESTARFDDPLDNFREFKAAIMRKCLLLYQKYYPKEKVIAALGKDAHYVLALWQLPEKVISEDVAVAVTATTATTSKELERQNKLSLFGMVTNYYDRIIGYLVQALNPEIPEPVRMALLRIVDGLTTFVEDILSEYELYYADEITIALSELRTVAGGAEAIQGSIGPGQPPVVSGAGASPAGPGAGQGQVNPGGPARAG